MSLEEITNNSKGFKCCPFCGDTPEVSNVGTFIDVECCVSMSIQKSDLMTREEHQTVDFDMDVTYMFPYNMEVKLLNIVRDKWNTRVV